MLEPQASLKESEGLPRRRVHATAGERRQAKLRIKKFDVAGTPCSRHY
jgi:hypothetical protein